MAHFQTKGIMGEILLLSPRDGMKSFLIVVKFLQQRLWQPTLRCTWQVTAIAKILELDALGFLRWSLAAA